MRDPPHPTLYTTDGVQREQRNVPLEEIIVWAERDPIWAQRGKAIQGYAQLENALATVLATLGVMPRETALTIFYKIVSTGSRNAILEKLLHKKHGAEFSPFWNEYLKSLRTIDIKRNEIVHWLAAANMGIDEQNIIHAGVTLFQPAAMDNLGAAQMLMTQDLIDFEKKCGEFSRLASMFSMATNPPAGIDQTVTQPWLDIFRQPFVYPLPANHLLFQQQPVPDNQPQPLPG